MAAGSSAASPWWKEAVVYQVYPRSFCDSNGDGIGDLRGITSKLDYLQGLGVDVVWLSPVYQSPNDDNGYDISDYRAILPEFGTMADFDAMLAGMHARGIRLVMDLVVNHCSDEHPWFVQGRTSRDNPYHDYFLWGAPVDRPNGRREPNNWESVFSGSAWEYNAPTGEYYLHMFTRKQPDLNWENPRLRAEVYDLMRFWLDKGVDGFRMDVINMISKPYAPDGSLPDAPVRSDRFLQPAFALSCNGPRVMEFLREMRREVLDHYDILTVGECPMISPRQGREMTDPQTGALHMVFQFEHMDIDSVPGHPDGKWAMRPVELPELKAILARWQTDLHGQGWNSLYWCNHDQPRPVSRFGDDGGYRVESAKMLATCLHLMQGTPYVYQGEELGMVNVPFEGIEACRDVETLNFFRAATTEWGWPPDRALAAIRAKGRDNARVPMPWDPAAPHGGFTTATPWIDAHPEFPRINAASALADPDSVYHYYRRLIALRKQHPIIVHGRFDLLLGDHPDLFAYTRTMGDECWLVLCNFRGTDTACDLPHPLRTATGDPVLCNYPDAAGGVLGPLTLRPYECRVYRLRSAQPHAPSP